MTVDLVQKVAFLRGAGVFDHSAVEVIETHMSWVFLTEEHAWKLKKPVRLPYLDHSTLERRRHSCAQELRLGRRLAADVYLDVVPLRAGPGGLSIGREGEIVDWLVKLRRLPTERMLPQMLARGAATLDHADAIAGLLAGFYRGAARTPWDGLAYRRRLRALILEVARELGDRRAEGHEPVVAAQLAVLDREADALDARVAAGRVVDAHGDLRPDHICLETPPVIIDPLEFDDGLRMLDVISELAFLQLECERLDAGWFGDRVAARCAELLGDTPAPALASLYRGQHALTRALIALRHLDDVDLAPSARPSWRAKAEDYLARARRACITPSA